MEADGIIKDMFDNQDRNKDGKILEEELMVKEDEERVVRDELWGECGPVVAPATVKKVVLEVIMEAIQTDIIGTVLSLNRKSVKETKIIKIIKH